MVACEEGKMLGVYAGNASVVVVAFVGSKRRWPPIVYFSSLSAAAADVLGASLIFTKPTSFSPLKGAVPRTLMANGARRAVRHNLVHGGRAPAL